MLAVRNTTDGIETRAVEIPTPPPVGGAQLVRVTSGGICGSDLHLIAAGPVRATLGHEFGGLLDDGTLVAVQPTVPCGECEYCRRGDQQICRVLHREFYGATRDGGLAEFALVADANIVAVPAEVDPATVGLVEPIAVAVHAINRIDSVPGQRVLVIGGGTIGLLCAAVLIDRGAVVDIAVRHPAQRAAAAAIGAGLEPAGRYPYVIDAVGTSPSIGQAVDASERGATIVLVGLPWEPVGLPFAAVMKEITVLTAVYYGTFRGEREFAQAGRFLADHPELPGQVITHRFALADASAAFRTAADRAAGAIKVQVVP